MQLLLFVGLTLAVNSSIQEEHFFVYSFIKTTFQIPSKSALQKRFFPRFFFLLLPQRAACDAESKPQKTGFQVRRQLFLYIESRGKPRSRSSPRPSLRPLRTVEPRRGAYHRPPIVKDRASRVPYGAPSASLTMGPGTTVFTAPPAPPRFGFFAAGASCEKREAGIPTQEPPQRQKGQNPVKRFGGGTPCPRRKPKPLLRGRTLQVRRRKPRRSPLSQKVFLSRRGRAPTAQGRLLPESPRRAGIFFPAQPSAL